MWALRSQLLGHSPHLSQTVLMEASDRTDVFPESVLFEILAANPDELKEDTLISYLKNKEKPLPEYMVNILKQVAGGTTYKTVLQQQMADYKHTYSRAANNIIQSILNDTVINYTDLRNWLDNLGGISSDRQIITTYIAENNYTDALALANMHPQLYSLQGQGLTEHNDYMDMLELYSELYLDGRNTFQMDSTEKAFVEYIADNGNGIARTMAVGIMEGVYGLTDYIDCPQIDGTQKSAGVEADIITPEMMGKAYGLSVTAIPNPATTWTAFDYTLPGENTKAEITITNTQGTVIKTMEATGNRGQKTLDTSNLPAGVYVYTI